MYVYLHNLCRRSLLSPAATEKQIYWPTSGSHSASQCERFQKKKTLPRCFGACVSLLVIVYHNVHSASHSCYFTSSFFFFWSPLRWHTWCQATASFLSSRGRMRSFNLHSCFNAFHEVHTGQYMKNGCFSRNNGKVYLNSPIKASVNRRPG